MNHSTTRQDEDERLRTLHELGLLDTAADPVLDGLVRTAASATASPVALIGLVDADRQWFKARHGIDADETARTVSFCTHTILGDGLMEVADATTDARFADNPLVAGPPGVRFYAGMPLAVDGRHVGALCVVDYEPRHLSPAQREVLTDLARAVEHWLASWREHLRTRRRSREFQDLTEQLPAIVYRYSATPPHQTLYVSPSIAALGYTPAAWTGNPQGWQQALHPRDRERVLAAMQAALAAGRDLEIDYRLRAADGRWRRVRDVSRPIVTDEGVRCVQGVILDVTSQLEAEARRDAAETYRRGLFELITDGVVVTDARSVVVDANPSTLGMLALRRDDIVGRPLRALFAEHERDRLDDALAATAIFVPTQSEWELERADGSHVPAEVTIRPLDEQRRLIVLRDITNRRRGEHHLRQLSLAVEQSVESIVITDAKGFIEYVNPAAVKSTGLTRDELLGSSAAVLGLDPTSAESAAGAWLAMSSGQPWSGILQGRAGDGGERIEHAVITPLRATDGRVTSFLAVKEDVTAMVRKDAELERFRVHLEELVASRTEQLERARLAAEAASAAKDTFLSAMSHTLRTPMSGVVGALDMLREAGLTPYQGELVEIIDTSADALVAVIDDVLDFARLEAGRVEACTGRVEIRRVLENVLTALRPAAVANGVDLHLHVDPRLPEVAVGDPARFRQVFSNLVDNAFKYSVDLERPGRVGVRAVVAAGERVEITVSDNGIGIPNDLLPRLFEPFTRGDESSTRRHGGTGLGLAIVRRLLDLMGGSIAVASAPGEGSSFTVGLPLARMGSDQPATLFDLSGIDCRIQSDDRERAADWSLQLAASGATVGPLANEGAWPTSPMAGAPQRVILVDGAADARAALGSFDAVARAGDGLVMLDRGPRHAPRVLAPGRVVVERPLVTRDALLRAVALAAGRVAPDVPAPAAAESAARADSQPHAIAGGTLRVLVAEDDAISRRVLAHQLAALGVAVELAVDGEQALAAWRSGRHALLITDLQMPLVDGFTLARRIRSEEAGGRRMPIIALSASATPGGAARCTEAGIDECLDKPVLARNLRVVLERWLPRSTEAVSRADTGPPRVDAAPDGPVFSAAVLSRVVGDDDLLVSRLHDDYLAALAHGVSALREAFGRGDWPRLAAVARRVATASRIVGAPRLAAACDRLESAGEDASERAAKYLLGEVETAAESVVAAMGRHAGTVDVGSGDHTAPRAIICEHDRLQAAMLRRNLLELGVTRIETCDTGLRALASTEGGDTTNVLLLLDLSMPVIDGVEMIRQLAEQRFAGATVLLGNGDPHVCETALRLARAYGIEVLATLGNPIGERRIREVIARWRARSGTDAAPAVVPVGSDEQLRSALRLGLLRIHFQPQVRLRDGVAVCCNALPSWQPPRETSPAVDGVTPGKGDDPPAGELARVLLPEAIAATRRWRQAGRPLQVAVAVSAQDLTSPRFSELLFGELGQRGTHAVDLRLEVAETELHREPRAIADMLSRLRLRGVCLTAAAFGTGRSSASQLRDLPFDTFKLDRCFVHECAAEAPRRGIFEAGVELARQLGRRVAVDGVETEDDWRFVRDAGCDTAQGGFIAAPMPAAALGPWLTEWNTRFRERLA